MHKSKPVKSLIASGNALAKVRHWSFVCATAGRDLLENRRSVADRRIPQPRRRRGRGRRLRTCVRARACSGRIESQDSQGSVNGRVWPALIRLWGLTMPQAYSADIRKRVIARVEGGASRRESQGNSMALQTPNAW
jgi:hypothetical protein